MRLHRILVLLVLAYVLLFPAFIEWWFTFEAAASRTYFVWGLIIAVAALVDYRRRRQ